jgi:hypothetical protein
VYNDKVINEQNPAAFQEGTITTPSMTGITLWQVLTKSQMYGNGRDIKTYKALKAYVGMPDALSQKECDTIMAQQVVSWANFRVDPGPNCKHMLYSDLGLGSISFVRFHDRSIALDRTKERLMSNDMGALHASIHAVRRAQIKWTIENPPPEQLDERMKAEMDRVAEIAKQAKDRQRRAQVTALRKAAAATTTAVHADAAASKAATQRASRGAAASQKASQPAVAYPVARAALQAVEDVDLEDDGESSHPPAIPVQTTGSAEAPPVKATIVSRKRDHAGAIKSAEAQLAQLDDSDEAWSAKGPKYRGIGWARARQPTHAPSRRSAAGARTAP